MSNSKKTKVCATCRDRKPITEFYKSPNKAYVKYGGRVPKCKTCVLKYDRKRVENHIGPKISGKKLCTGCNRKRHVRHFNKRLRAKDGLRSRCRDCEQKKEHEYRNANKKRQQFNKIWSVYGLSEKEYLEMLTKQKSRCKICKRLNNLVIDHDHKDLYVRGLLCQRCNLGLGAFCDDTEALKNAIKYLKDARKNPKKLKMDKSRRK